MARVAAQANPEYPVSSGNVVISEDNLEEDLSKPFSFLLRQPTLVIEEELVYEFNRSDGATTITFEVTAEDAMAKNVEVALSELKSGENIALPGTAEFETVSVDLIGEGRSRGFTLTVEPLELPVPGVYSGKITIKADNLAEEKTATLTLIVPAQKLTTSPDKLVIQRCWPYFPGLGFGNWPIRFLLGCSDGGQKAAVWAVGDNVVADVKALPSSARSTTGHDIDFTLYKEEAGEFTLLNADSLISVEAISKSNVQVLLVDVESVPPYAGAYTGAIYMESPDMTEPAKVDVLVNVRHFYVLPLLLIIGGIFLATYLLRITDEEDNPKLASFEIKKLRELLAKNAKVPSKVREKVKAILDNAEISLPNDVASAKELMQSAETILAKVNEVIKQIEKLREDINVGEFGYPALVAAERHLKNYELDKAKEKATRAADLKVKGEALRPKTNVLLIQMTDHDDYCQDIVELMPLIEKLHDMVDQKNDFDPEKYEKKYDYVKHEFGEHLDECDAFGPFWDGYGGPILT